MVHSQTGSTHIHIPAGSFSDDGWLNDWAPTPRLLATTDI